MRKIILLALIALLCGCKNRKSASQQEVVVYQPRHSTLYSIIECGESSIIRVNGEDQNLNMELFVSHDGEKPPVGFKGGVVSSPVKRVICMSSSYTAFMEAVGCVDNIVGVSGANFISSTAVHDRYTKGLIKDVGFDNTINLELVASLKPDIVLMYGVLGENAALKQKLAELNIQALHVGDYVESSPLGKAEWIVAIGELMGKRQQAIDHFNAIEKEYNTLCSRVKSLVTNDDRPTVMLNAPWRDVWYVPGDQNYIVKLIHDAGGKYVCSGVNESKSRAISIETAYLKAADADFWLNPNSYNTIADLINDNPKFAKVKSVTDKNVFNCTKISTPQGGSDFWERGAIYPNLVLSDLIHIFHPSISTEESVFFKRLE